VNEIETLVGKESETHVGAVMIVPEQLAVTCRGISERMAWLGRLPDTVRELQDRWALRLGPPWSDATGAWVAPAVRADGTRVVLKVGMPHMEAAHEIEGLRFWDGEPTVRLIEADEGGHALLVERCEPGTSLRQVPEAEADVVLAALLRRMWRAPVAPHPFRPLSVMLAYWAEETLAACAEWPDAGLVRAGLDVFNQFGRASPDDVLLATDLHAGNVLRTRREPWLVIDPKPFVGDPAYDATQHLFNCKTRMAEAPEATISRFADLLAVDCERVRMWTFARSAAEPRGTWTDASLAVARALG
jgi:streptomycin 6-kinase